MNNKNIHVELKKIRTQLGLTQKEFGNEFGISAQTVFAYESGRRNIPLKLMIALKNKYNIDLNAFSEDTDEKDLQTMVFMTNDLYKQFHNKCNAEIKKELLNENTFKLASGVVYDAIEFAQSLINCNNKQNFEDEQLCLLFKYLLYLNKDNLTDLIHYIESVKPSLRNQNFVLKRYNETEIERKKRQNK